MNTVQLSLQQTPSLDVPLRFFLTAPIFAMLAMLLWLIKGETLFINRWSADVLAFTHFFTLGWMLQIMSGALLQLLPVLLGVTFFKSKLWSTLIHTSLTLGTLFLTGGWLFELKILLQISYLFLLFGSIILVSILSFGLLKSQNTSPILISIRLALIALIITLGLGFILLTLFAFSVHISNPIYITKLHITWGLIGWTLLLIVGIAYQVVPMFQITPPYPHYFSRSFAPFLFGILISWTVGIPLDVMLIFLTTSFAIVTLDIQSKRLRKLPDITLSFWRFGMLSLIANALFYLTGYVWDFPQRELFQSVLFIGGFILPVIQGMLYKIVPFLVWLHLTNAQMDLTKKIKVPHMKQIIVDKWQRWQFWLFLIFFFIALISIIFPNYFAYLAAFLGLSAFAFLEYNLMRATQLYLNIRNQINRIQKD
jgi:hypothetical protein